MAAGQRWGSGVRRGQGNAWGCVGGFRGGVGGREVARVVRRCSAREEVVGKTLEGWCCAARAPSALTVG